jgi:hypothetical protein
MGMIVRSGSAAAVSTACSWTRVRGRAADDGYERLWVATGTRSRLLSGLWLDGGGDI